MATVVAMALWLYGYAIAIVIAMVVFVTVARRLCESEVHERSEWDSCLSYCA